MSTEKGIVCPGFALGGCSFEQLPCFGILSDAPGGLVRACVGVGGEDPVKAILSTLTKFRRASGVWERTLKD